MRYWLPSFVVLFLLPPAASSADPVWTRKEDVIYSRKFGVALTMDVFTPKEKANGAAIVYCISGGFFSSKEAINPLIFTEAFNRGYTVFAVVHGSQPKFTIPEIVDDMHRAVRFIRHHAREYGIDPNRIGITGGSAGGHLSLMMGCAGTDGDPKAKDPIDRGSSRVQAVACFFPPTDFLNYGKEGEVALGTGVLAAFKAPFDFMEFDPKTRSFTPVTDEDKRKEIGRKISPIYFVDEKSAPTLLIHGDADKLVPIQQSERIIERLKAAKVPCELVVKKDEKHGWPTILTDVKTLIDWFDKHLQKPKE